ncbi:MAG TPA: MdtA/MuxA family multidrug efflux RND transporter periplasmic adaptor subunit [Magnetospirillum sp.]|jgi:multidrug efflux system membrane fusion protein|nr:MdtA/MuxA family multidrug efflux RND transporter periplasmic adaptor subunit [Magnetospirillum sp.]
MNSENFQPVRQRADAQAGKRKRPVWVLLVVLAVLAGLGWVVFRPHTAPQQQGRRGAGGPVPVVVAAASKADVDIGLSALGTVTPLATVTVRTQIAGQLLQIAFREGQTVHAGDFLAQIDPRPYQMQLDQYMGQLARDQALLKDAQVNLARYEKLLAEDSIARQQRDTQSSLVKQYEGAVATDLAQVNNAKLNIAYCRIVSPITGRVGLRQVDQGNYVQTNDTNGIAVITQMEPISTVFSVPEDNLPAIMRRLREGATLTVAAFDRSQTHQLAEGHVTTVDNQIDPATGTVKLRAEFDNKDETLFPNQFVNLRLLVDTQRDAVVVPASAIQRGEPGTFVYVVKPDNTVTVRTVGVGPASGGKVAIQSGLETGEQVVVDGADKLREGAQVSVPGAESKGEGAPKADEGRAGGGNGERRKHRSE